MAKKTKRAAGKWISVLKRRAIYFRDGHVCCFCGRDEQTIISECDKNWDMLSLDHILPYSEGGSNAANNLITCCRDCNTKRKTRTPMEFADHLIKEGVMTSEDKNNLAIKICNIVVTNDSRSKVLNTLHNKGFYDKAQKYLDRKKDL